MKKTTEKIKTMKKQKKKKKMKKHHFTEVHHKLWSYARLFPRYDVWRM